MKPAARHFFLALVTLWGAPSCQAAKDEACPISPKAIVSDACASYSTLEKLNSRVKPVVDDLTRSTDFFSHYRLNLFNKQCPFWNDENGMCGNIACAVQTLDNEEDIPEVWRAHELGKLEGPSAKHPGKEVQRKRPQKPLRGELGEDVGESCVVEYDDECDERDYCVPEDESATSKGDYVSLIVNPERFTGYAGDGARQVWNAIYRENCFQKSSFPSTADVSKFYSPAKNPAALDFKSVLDTVGRQQVLEAQRQQNPNTPFVAQTGHEAEDECLEKRVFYRVMSGMHASISTHLCWDFLNQTTGEWTPNLNCYEFRLHKFPDRISNLYFNYALLTRAIAKLGPHISLGDYTFCTDDLDQDSTTRAKVLAVTEAAASVPQIFDESLMFKNGEGPSLKEDFRNRFRNVSRLMDCVGCDKCRLWGKLQTAGYGTALKVLFEMDNDAPEVPMLKRTELVALFNTYARLASSLNAITKFRVMYEERERDRDLASVEAVRHGEEKESPAEKEGTKSQKIEFPDQAKKPHHAAPEPASSPSANADSSSVKNEEAPKGEPDLETLFWKEYETVLKVTKYVVRSWIDLPKTLYKIAVSEMVRAWQYYLGLPVNPRNWDWNRKRPDLDEL